MAQNDNGFHWRDNIYWKRLGDGSVRIAFFVTRASGHPIEGDDDEPVRELIIPPNEWASIVASVSEGNRENSTSMAASIIHKVEGP